MTDKTKKQQCLFGMQDSLDWFLRLGVRSLTFYNNRVFDCKVEDLCFWDFYQSQEHMFVSVFTAQDSYIDILQWGLYFGNMNHVQMQLFWKPNNPLNNEISTVL